jgi:DNA-binding transcriptional LysR family regulator
VGATVMAGRFLSQRLPTLRVDHPGLKVELAVRDRFGDMIEDRLDLALRVRRWLLVHSQQPRQMPLS